MNISISQFHLHNIYIFFSLSCHFHYIHYVQLIYIPSSKHQVSSKHYLQHTIIIIEYAITQGLYQTPIDQCHFHHHLLNHNPHLHSLYQYHCHHHHPLLKPLSDPSPTLQTVSKSLGSPDSLMLLSTTSDLL